MLEPAKLTILNVDSNTSSGRSHTLHQAGFAVIEAATGLEALRLVYSAKPVLVVLTVQLPDIDGLEVCRRIKADPATATTLILQISTASGETQGREPDHRADGFLVDPVAPQELTATVKTLLRLWQSESEKRQLLARLQQVTTERNREETMHSERAFLRHVIDATPSLIMVKDLAGRYRLVNQAAARLLGTTIESLLGMTDADLDSIAGTALAPVLHRDDRGVIENRREVRSELALNCADQQLHWFSTVRAPLIEPDGSCDKLLIVATDITARKRAEQALQDSAARLSAIVSAVPDVLLVLDEEGRYLEILTARPQLLYTSPVKLKGRLISEVLPPGVAQLALAAIRQTLLTGLPQSFEYELPIGRAGTHYFEARTAPLQGPALDKPAVVLLARDVTQHRRTEENLRQAQKMEAVGQLTGGVAHDFNNLLAVILGNLELLAEALDESSALTDLVQRALTAVERGATLIRRLLAFARRQPLLAQAVDLNQLVAGMIDLLHRTLGETIEVQTVLARDLAQSVIDAGQFETALLNLALNARDAMPGGGRLIIETANRWLDEDYARTQIFQVHAGRYVMLAVSDTGSGMPPEVLAHAFEPFFTTKEVGKGSGLGLSMVYGLVKQSGGHIQLYSEVGRGTTIRIYLPAMELAARAVPDKRAGERVPHSGQGQTVLVVEDETPVRRLAVRMLQSLGYQTVEAETAAVALQVLTANPQVTVLFTDVVLPGGSSGVDLAQEARRQRPELKVLFTSGYPEAHLARFSRNPSGDELLNKPYRKSELAGKLHALLGQPSEG